MARANIFGRHPLAHSTTLPRAHATRYDGTSDGGSPSQEGLYGYLLRDVRSGREMRFRQPAVEHLEYTLFHRKRIFSSVLYIRIFFNPYTVLII